MDQGWGSFGPLDYKSDAAKSFLPELILFFSWINSCRFPVQEESGCEQGMWREVFRCSRDLKQWNAVCRCGWGICDTLLQRHLEEKKRDLNKNVTLCAVASFSRQAEEYFSFTCLISVPFSVVSGYEYSKERNIHKDFQYGVKHSSCCKQICLGYMS